MTARIGSSDAIQSGTATAMPPPSPSLFQEWQQRLEAERQQRLVLQQEPPPPREQQQEQQQPQQAERDGPTPRTKRRRVVAFSTVEIYSHDGQLAGDRVPSSQALPVGLGRLREVQMRRIESFETSRADERTGVQLIDEDVRRSAVCISRVDSIDEVEAEAELTRQQREASLEDNDLESPRMRSRSPAPDAALFSLIGPQQHADDEPSLSDLFGF